MSGGHAQPNNQQGKQSTLAQKLKQKNKNRVLHDKQARASPDQSVKLPVSKMQKGQNQN
jgi:hypothetical protein